jgi:hypothetical protein
MAITAPIAGAYTGTYNSVAINYTRSGYNINFMLRAERVDETDIYGNSLIDLIYRGAQLTIDTIAKVYAAGSTGPLAAWASSFNGQVYAAAKPIAQLASTAAAALVLTAVANTPAASSPATFTATKSIISPDNNFSLIFNSQLREVPLRWDVLTTDSAGTGSMFALT